MLVGGRPARAGWLAMIAFQWLLMLFGWGFWLWSVPATAVLVAGAHRDWARLGSSWSGAEVLDVGVDGRVREAEPFVQRPAR